MSEINSHLELLGLKVKDRVTGLEGIVTTVSFDLYGCIQAVIHPGLTAEGAIREGNWFDVNRLVVLDPVPVMTVPNFVEGYQAKGLQGCSEKPMATKA